MESWATHVDTNCTVFRIKNDKRTVFVAPAGVVAYAMAENAGEGRGRERLTQPTHTRVRERR